MEKLKLNVKTLRRLSNQEASTIAGGTGDSDGPISGIGCDADMPTYYCTVLCTVFFCDPAPGPGPGPGPDPFPQPATTMNVCSPGPFDKPL